jgi:hypothetical protein
LLLCILKENKLGRWQGIWKEGTEIANLINIFPFKMLQKHGYNVKRFECTLCPTISGIVFDPFFHIVGAYGRL